MNKYVEAAIIFVAGILIGWAVGTFLGWAASEQGASSDMVFLAHIVPSFVIGGLGGFVAALRVAD